MIAAILFGAIVSIFSITQYSFDDCKVNEFKGKQCEVAKKLYENR